MADTVIFYMWKPFREGLIESHRFFFAEGKKRLLSQLTDATISADAERNRHDWLARKAPRIHPSHDGAAEIYMEAINEMLDYWGRLRDLQDIVRFSIIASFYHEWEKQLRRWLAKEMDQHITGGNTQQAIWKASISDIIDFLECCSWPIKSRPYYTNLDRCRMVVNVYKHGDGPSFQQLRKHAPDLIFRSTITSPPFPYTPDYGDMKVSDDDMEEFSAAIIHFWKDVPEHIFQSQINNEPVWFQKALGADFRARSNNSTSKNP